MTGCTKLRNVKLTLLSGNWQLVTLLNTTKKGFSVKSTTNEYTIFIMADRSGGMVTTNTKARPERPQAKKHHGVSLVKHANVFHFFVVFHIIVFHRFAELPLK